MVLCTNARLAADELEVRFRGIVRIYVKDNDSLIGQEDYAIRSASPTTPLSIKAIGWAFRMQCENAIISEILRRLHSGKDIISRKVVGSKISESIHQDLRSALFTVSRELSDKLPCGSKAQILSDPLTKMIFSAYGSGQTDGDFIATTDLRMQNKMLFLPEYSIELQLEIASNSDNVIYLRKHGMHSSSFIGVIEIDS